MIQKTRNIGIILFISMFKKFYKITPTLVFYSFLFFLQFHRTHTGSKEMITQDHAYHGHVVSLMEISPYKFNKSGGGGCPPGTHVVAVPDIYRGKFRYISFG